MIRSIFLLLLSLLVSFLLAPTILIVQIIRLSGYRASYVKNVAIGVDQLGGTILYNEKDWTVSSYTYHLSKNSKIAYFFMKFINLLFGKNHCRDAYIWEKQINQMEIKDI